LNNKINIKKECEYDLSSNSLNNRSLFLNDEKYLNSRISERNSINKSKSYDNSFVFLIIEDNVNIRSIQKNLLRKVLDKMKITDKLDFEYKIIVGEDGIDALRLVIDPLLSSRIKGIFTDENMEFMNGSESIKIIRNLQKLNKISYFNICTVTAFEDKATASEIKFMGVDDILKKPLSKTQLEDYFVRFPFIKKEN
jgi:CheY-like chemotaxis protein